MPLYLVALAVIQDLNNLIVSGQSDILIIQCFIIKTFYSNSNTWWFNSLIVKVRCKKSNNKRCLFCNQ